MSGEPANFSLEEAARWRAKQRRKLSPGPRPTLGDLQRSTPWLWMHCERCQHRAPFACAVAVIRWGADESSDRLRQCVRCTCCGGKGATIQHPGWGGNSIGLLPFPAQPPLCSCLYALPESLLKRPKTPVEVLLLSPGNMREENRLEVGLCGNPALRGNAPRSLPIPAFPQISSSAGFAGPAS